MTAEAGHFALVLALVLTCVQSTVPLWGARRGDAVLMSRADYDAWMKQAEEQMSSNGTEEES